MFPPLAGSDWLAANRKGAIEAVVAGLNREIVVNGRTYRGQMPPVIIDDDEVAAVLTFVVTSWGNRGAAFTADEVRAVRATTPFKTFAELKAAGDYRPLPAAPREFSIREVVRLGDFGVRLAGDGRGGPLYVLGQAGGATSSAHVPRPWPSARLPSPWLSAAGFCSSPTRTRAAFSWTSRSLLWCSNRAAPAPS